ncbi:BatA domain-containing protein [Aquitalea sp. LB_tupeE]|uniref:BatA domain-containing protein n=1 Tax=Aquitalea sp. LB_tupeE TaxID=2748078 RepID=UPI0015BED8DB|nr:BatA domain-containing protein [Aquitalea sp. LB_tupeE]NWK80313.1 hypothetical protein [Aquitalea sp. LB_tupeE]
MDNIFMVLVTGLYAVLMLLYFRDVKKRKAIHPGFSLAQDIREQAKAGNQIAKLISLLQWLVLAYVAINVAFLILAIAKS